MKRIAIISVLLMSVLTAYGQFFKADRHGEELYQSGTRCIELGDYKRADSLLSQALCTYKNGNVYYNRGVSKLFLRDTTGFCSDMGVAANKYLDPGAQNYFNRYCCKRVDTTWYDKKMNPSTKPSARYYEVYKELKYENERMCEIHDIEARNIIPSLDYGCNQDLLSINTKTSDIIGLYKYVDGVKFYYYTEQRQSLSFNNQKKYDVLKKRMTMFLSGKYKELKEKNKVNTITIGYSINLSQNGDVLSAEYIGSFPEINFGNREKEFKEDIEHNARYYPKASPAEFMGKNVDSIVYDAVTF